MAKATTADMKPQSKTAGDKATKPAKAGKPAKAEKPSLWARFVGYLKGVRTEMQRVVWPKPLQVRDSSVVVLVTLIFFVAFTAVVDSIVIEALKLLDVIPSPFQ